MKAKAALIIAILIALGLGVGIIVVNQRAVDQKKKDDNTIVYYSNYLTEVQNSLTEEKTVNLQLETNLATTKLEYSNKLSVAETSLATLSTSLSKLQSESKAAAEAAAAQIAERDKKIASLENQNQELDKEAADLRTAITNLESQIATVKEQLANTKGERDFLQSQLKRLMAERDDLERKFNDLDALRAQVKKIKNELADSRRLDWARRGLLDASTMKGAIMQTRRPTPPPATNVLQVELHQNGQIKVNETPSASTNAPQAK
jgi:chromosome segregation ATPase